MLEAASERYRALSTMLRGRGWKAKLRLRSVLLEESIRQEPAVLEALANLKRRAEREPEGTAGTRLQELDRTRDALSADIHRRLPVDALPELVHRLEWLKSRVLRPLPLPPGEGERVLLEGNAFLPPFGMSLGIVTVAVALLRFAGPGAAAGLLALFAVITWLRSGRYWLTSERLLWQPRRGEPEQVSLAAIREGSIRFNPFTDTLKVGRPGLTLRHVPRASGLATLLSIRRRKEFRNAAAVRDSQRLVAVLPAYRCRPGEYPDVDAPPDGLLVLRPAFIAYFPTRPAATVLDAITEPEGAVRGPSWARRDAVSVSMEQLLEQILLLPEEEMDHLLRQTARLWPENFHRYCLLWEPSEVECKFGGNTSLELAQGGVLLYADRLTWLQHHAAGRVIALWPHS